MRKEQKIRKLIFKYSRWWIHWMGLGYWNVNVLISNKKKKKKSNSFLCGEVFCDWRYLNFTVTFYPKNMLNFSDKEIEEVVIHELVHVFLNEMRSQGIDHEERVATSLQKAFSWVKYNS